MSQAESPRDVLVLTVDDQASFREVARRVVEVVPGFRWIGEACTGEEALAFVRQQTPDLVIMDVRMPGMGGWTRPSGSPPTRPGSRSCWSPPRRPRRRPTKKPTPGSATVARKQDFGPALLRAAVAGPVQEEQSGLDPLTDVLGAGEAELGEDRVDVLLDRALGQHQRLGDGGVALALRDLAEHLELARR